MVAALLGHVLRHFARSQPGEIFGPLAPLAHFIKDRRSKPETRLRALKNLLDHADGRAKDPLEVDDSGPKYPEVDTLMLEAILQMRREVQAKRKKPPALPQDREESVNSVAHAGRYDCAHLLFSRRAAQLRGV